MPVASGEGSPMALSTLPALRPSLRSAKPENANRIGLCVRVDLERDRRALGDADVRRKTLNRPIAGATNLPITARISRLRVFADNVIGHRWRASKCLSLSRAAAEETQA